MDIDSVRIPHCVPFYCCNYSLTISLFITTGTIFLWNYQQVSFDTCVHSFLVIITNSSSFQHYNSFIIRSKRTVMEYLLNVQSDSDADSVPIVKETSPDGNNDGSNKDMLMSSDNLVQSVLSSDKVAAPPASPTLNLSLPQSSSTTHTRSNNSIIPSNSNVKDNEMFDNRVLYHCNSPDVKVPHTREKRGRRRRRRRRKKEKRTRRSRSRRSRSPSVTSHSPSSTSSEFHSSSRSNRSNNPSIAKDPSISSITASTTPAPTSFQPLLFMGIPTSVGYQMFPTNIPLPPGAFPTGPSIGHLDFNPVNRAIPSAPTFQYQAQCDVLNMSNNHKDSSLHRYVIFLQNYICSSFFSFK